jgi:D-beta-D-heptose 7-phosphate kinase/D-beta-D-heptose 1-phosphate adenosyltransferase
VLNKKITCSVIVIGDIICDRFISGNINRLSPEAPVPILCNTNEKIYIGGSGNVALNLAAMGCKTYIIGTVGSD